AITPGSAVARTETSSTSGVGSGPGRRSTVSTSQVGQTMTYQRYSSPHFGQNTLSLSSRLQRHVSGQSESLRAHVASFQRRVRDAPDEQDRTTLSIADGKQERMICSKCRNWRLIEAEE